MAPLHLPRRHSTVGSLPHTLISLLLSVLGFFLLSACENAAAPEPASTLQLSSSMLELQAPGDTARLKAVKQGEGSQINVGKGVIWSIDDPWIATVNESGLVVARNKGEAVITASSPIGSSRARVRVLRSRIVDISPKADTLTIIGDSAWLSAKVMNQGGKSMPDAAVTWVSLDPEVATVDAAGMVIAKSSGVAKIKAASSRWADTAQIMIHGGASVTVTPSSRTLAAGDSVRLVANATNVEGALVPNSRFTWSSSDPAVAIVDSDGLVTSLAEGEVKITATLVGGSSSSSASAPITVGRRGQLEISVSPAETTIEETGDSIQLTATVRDARGDIVPDASVTWSSEDPNVAIVDQTGRVVARAAGIVLITAALGGESTASQVTVAQSPEPLPSEPTQPVGSPAELPRASVDTRYPRTSGKTTRVSAGADLQDAINAAEPGDVLRLEAGATFVGNFTLPEKSGDGWIVIRTDADLPPEGTRVGPEHAPLMPKLVSPGYDRALETEDGAHHYRLVGLEITHAADVREANAIVELSDAHTITIDRSYIHGHDQLDFKRCILLHADNSAVIDSYISECHGDGHDSQAILAWNANGPFKIVNNYLEGAGETIMFGGAMPDRGVIPSDIEIRRNHFFRPLSWKGKWSVKNHFEIKFARRVVLEGNVFENHWADGQDGMVMNIKISDEDGRCTWCVVEDITVRNNWIKNVDGGIKISDTDRVLIANNVFEELKAFGSSGRLFTILRGPRDLVIENNTAFPTYTIATVSGTRLGGEFVMRNNIFDAGAYGIKGSGEGEGTDTLEELMPGYVFRGNVLIDASPSSYPDGNFFPDTRGDVGFVNAQAGDYRLSNTSRFLNRGTDGQNPGADISVLRQAIEGVAP